MRRLFDLVRRFGKNARFDALDLCSWDRPFDSFFLVQDVEHWWRELDF